MDYIRFAINNPVKVAVGVMLLILFGVIALITIPIQLVPNVDQPVITVETNWRGRSPEEVEKEIIEEQEDKLKGVSGLRKMSAEASLGRGQIELEFFIGTDMGRALQEVSDKLREVPQYPDDVDEPVITVADAASENAIAWMVLTSGDPSFDIDQLRDAAEDRIKPYLERVAGLSEVNVYGGRDREVHIRIDPRRLAERGITFNQLMDALRLENVNVSAGDLRDGYRDVRVRTIGQYDALDPIRDTIVADTDGGPVRVRDLGDVVLTLSKRRSFVRSRASPALALNAIRESGSNVLQVMHGTRDGRKPGLQQRIREVNETILPHLGPDLQLTQVYDETVYIQDAIKMVRRNLLVGGSMAVLALILFLRIIRPTLIVALAIPISVVGTFVVMAGAGRNLNVVSLAGLAFAVGMVVDNAIVVLENIDRHLSMGKQPGQAAYDGTREVWGAIVAATLTTLAVFFPVVFMKEEAGQLFRDIAIAIIAAVSLSLVVAVTVIPSAAARWLRARREPKRAVRAFRELFGLTRVLNGLTDRLANWLYALTAPGWGRVGVRAAIVAGFTGVSVLGAWALMPPASYLPNGNRNLTFGIMLTPPAYAIDHNETIAHRVEEQLEPYWKAQTMEAAAALDPVPVMDADNNVVMLPSPPIENYFFVTFGGTIFMGASSKNREVVSPLSGLITQAMNQVPGAIGFAFQPSIFGRGVGGGNAIDVEVTGSDINRVRRSAEALYMALGQKFGFHSIGPEPANFNMVGPELKIMPDRVRAAALGVDMSKLGLAVQALVDGATIGDYRLQGETIDILLTRHPDYPLTVDAINTVPVAYHDRQGNMGTVPLSAVALFKADEAPQEIRRIEERRAVTLVLRPSADTPLERATADVVRMIDELCAAGQIDPDIEITAAGTASKLADVRTALLGRWDGWTLESLKNIGLSRIFLALLVTYLLMAALFESYLYPFVIMFTVPLATVGGFLGLAIVNAITAANPLVPTQQLDVLTMLGFVILIGVVVNNAILVVHQALNFMRGVGESESDRREPMPHREAIRESVRTRIRPIFMTTTTSVFGMLPLVLMPGAGSELYRGLGSVVVGGLVMATLFTLIVVPILFSLVLDAKLWLARRLGGPADGAGVLTGSAGL